MEGICGSKISPVLTIVTGTTGASARIAILKLPPWNGPISPSTLLLVPSGKIRTLCPVLISSTAFCTISAPFCTSSRSRKIEWIRSIHFLRNGTFFRDILEIGEKGTGVKAASRIRS